ncbi:ketopantoate reductase family protein [Amycolatopsis sp. GM8]|uniref:ketopantoate reductase family protein n=1 Tax=Amycolatopsis sp. GM8 TaxID=2896530 RepID=UPI001F00A6AB|nr:2-dehydropantoate 2-reductase [Amycolatopsis sp. GM8]
MRTLIIGAGAVGSTLGGYLARGGRDVTIADGWPRHVEAVRARGLRVEAVEGDFEVELPAIHLDELAGFGPADLIVVASKSYDTRMMALLAREHLHDGTVVMSAQNGMNDALLASVVGHDRVIACVVALGADLVVPGVVRRSSETSVTPAVFGPLWPGADAGAAARIRDHFLPLGAVKAVNDAWPERWGKLTLNSMSNALAGLAGHRSDTLWTEPLSLDVIVALGHETAMVAEAEGIAAAPVLGRISHATLLEATATSTPAWQEALDQMRRIGDARRGRKSNRASLLQDIEKKRRTEIHYLNGWIAGRGAELGVATGTHLRIVEELRSVEAGERPPALVNVEKLAAEVREWYA